MSNMKQSERDTYHTLGSFTTFHDWKNHITMTLDEANELKESALRIAKEHQVKIKHVTGKGMRRTSTTPSLPAWVWGAAIAKTGKGVGHDNN